MAFVYLQLQSHPPSGAPIPQKSEKPITKSSTRTGPARVEFPRFARLSTPGMTCVVVLTPPPRRFIGKRVGRASCDRQGLNAASNRSPGHVRVGVSFEVIDTGLLGVRNPKARDAVMTFRWYADAWPIQSQSGLTSFFGLCRTRQILKLPRPLFYHGKFQIACFAKKIGFSRKSSEIFSFFFFLPHQGSIISFTIVYFVFSADVYLFFCFRWVK